MKIIKLLSQSSGLKKSIFNTVGNAFATSLSALSLIILSRLLGPSLFGEFSVGFSLLLIFIRVIDLGLSTGTIKLIGQSHEKNTIKKIYSITYKYKIISTLVLTLIGLGLSSYLNNFLKLSHPQIINLAFVFGFATVCYEQILTTVFAIGLVKQAVIVNALQASTKLVAAIIYLITQYKDVQLSFGIYALAPIMPVLFTRLLLPSWLKFDLKATSSKIKHQIFKIIPHTYLNSLSTCLTENVSILFVQGYLSSYDAGLFGGASKISMLFSVITGSLSQVLFPRVAKYQNKENLQAYLKKAIILAIAILLSFVLFVPFTRQSIVLTIGTEYISGTLTLLILVAASFISIATVPFTALFYSTESDWYFSIIGFLQIIVTLLGCWLFIPKYGLIAAALTQLICRSIILLVTFIWGLHFYRKKVKV